MKILWFLILAILGLSSSAGAQLSMNFYNQSCPNAETIIKDFVFKHISNAPSLAAPLLRMHFHDCFVRGCDGSVLLDTSPGSANQTEKFAPPNLTMRGFDFIDRIKALLETMCPGVVSCADIIALAARDAIVLTRGPSWKVPTGRYDGRISNTSEAANQVPAPTSNFSNLQTLFGNKGLDITDLVVLSGAHTVGLAHCSSFSTRLYNFTGVEDQDPGLDSEYASNLKQLKCLNVTDNITRVEMDPGSRKTFDLSYYRGVLLRRGLFSSDNALRTNSVSLGVINKLLQGSVQEFYAAFAASMEKMGRIDVKNSSTGEIRKRCRFVN